MLFNRVAAIACGVIAAQTALAQSYSIGQIGTDADQLYHVAGISNAGVVAGSDLSLYHPWRWTAGTGLTALPTFGSHGQGDVTGLNELGACVGWASNNAYVDNPCFWSTNGAITNISGGGRYSYTACALNDLASPTIVGMHQTSGNGGVAAVRQGNTWTDLPSLGGSGIALNVDGNGRIVGICFAPDQTERVVLWTKNSAGKYVVTDLTATKGLVAPPYYRPGYANANSPVLIRNGRVASMGQILDLSTGFVMDLAFQSGHPGLTIFGINSSGQAVGTMDVPQRPFNAPFYFDGSSVSNLNDIVAGSGWNLTSARGINDNGMIVGLADTSPAGSSRVYILDLTP